MNSKMMKGLYWLSPSDCMQLKAKLVLQSWSMVEAINALARIATRIYHINFADSDCGVILQNEVICNCSGTTCRVAKLYFSNLGMRGKIPEEIGNLTSLAFLDLTHNRLRGKIPNSLEKLSDLSAIYLDDNKLEGLVPPVFRRMKSLTDLLNQLCDSPEEGNMLEGATPGRSSLTLNKTLVLSGFKKSTL